MDGGETDLAAQSSSGGPVPGSPSGCLTIAAAQPGPGGAAGEQTLPFHSLQELLDLCVANAGSGAFLRVLVEGASGSRSYRLGLDFGHFALTPDPAVELG